MDTDDIRARLAVPETRRGALIQISEWVKYTCLVMGTSPKLAYEVAAIFADGLQKDWERTTHPRPEAEEKE